MFAYALIAAELLLISLVFYFVFVREPKPFEVKENMWGYYGSSDGENVNNLPTFVSVINEELAFPQKKKISKRRRINHQLKRMMRRTRHGVRKGFEETKPALKNGWIYVSEDKPNCVGNLLAYLGQLLTNLSAKFS